MHTEIKELRRIIEKLNEQLNEQEFISVDIDMPKHDTPVLWRGISDYSLQDEVFFVDSYTGKEEHLEYGIYGSYLTRTGYVTLSHKRADELSMNEYATHWKYIKSPKIV